MPLPDVKAGKDEMFAYLAQILPDYDTERVFVGDIKKVIKWYKFLSDRGLLHKEADIKEKDPPKTKEDESTEASGKMEDSDKSTENQDDKKD